MKKRKFLSLIIASMLLMTVFKPNVFSAGGETLTDEVAMTLTDEVAMTNSPKAFAHLFIDEQNKKSEGVVQVSDDRYLTDSPFYESPPGVTPGSFRDSKVSFDEQPSYMSTDAQGNPVSVPIDSFQVTFKATESLDASTWADRFLEENSGWYDVPPTKDRIIELIGDDAHPQLYEDQYTREYDVTVRVKEVTTVVDGVEVTEWKLYYDFPENFPTDLTLAMTEIMVDGVLYDIPHFKEVYLSGMEGEPIDEDEDDDDEDDDDDDDDDNDDDEDNPDPDPDPETGYSWAYVTNGITSYQHLNPAKSGSISNPQYDVSTAIPTSENLTFSATADDSLYDIGVRTYTGKAGVNGVKVIASASYTYHYTETYVKKSGYWSVDDEGEPKWVAPVYGTRPASTTKYKYHTVDSSYTTSITETYYDVPISNIYPVGSASFSGAPVNATVSLTGGPTVGAKTTNVTSQHPGIGASYTHYLGHYSSANNAQAAAENGESSAKNAIVTRLYASINQSGYFSYSYRGLKVTPTTNNGTKPSVVQTSNSTTKMIPSTKENGNYATSGTVSYSNGSSFGFGVNDVFVHTPVVNKAKISETSPFINQKINVDPNRVYLMLDEDFTIQIPNEGTHRPAKGYNTRIYNMYQAVTRLASNWGKIKDVKLPFDAYLHMSDGTKVFVKADTWLNDLGLATNQNEYTFTIPVWAEEGNGTIETRVVAENAIWFSKLVPHDGTKMEENANLNPDNYIATKTIDVEVIGKIYDLRISGTNDPGWTNIKGKDGNYVTAAEFPFGQAGQNQMTAYKFAPKLGYVVEFDFKTKGIKTNNVDVSIQPEGFYFVGKNGGTAEEVDLYYKTSASQYVKIQTGISNSSIVVNLANKFMKVAVSELTDSQRIMKNTIGVKYTYAENVNIGAMPALSLPDKLRLCYNNFAEYVNKLYKKNEAGIIADAAGRFVYTDSDFNKVTNGRDTVIASVGHWYAGYRLPSSTVAVPKGTTASQLISNPGLAKKEGYILVKFDLVGKYGIYDYLRYTGPESINETTKDNTGEYEKDKNGKDMKWQDPTTGNPDSTSPTIPITLPNGKPAVVPDGTVMMFETDLRANSDYETEGTH